MTYKNNRAPNLYYNKLCASFQNHGCFQSWGTVQKRSIRVKISDYLSRVTLKFHGWQWKTLGHLFYTMSKLVHRFKAMGEFKLMLQSGNVQFGSKSANFLVPCDLEICWTILKNNRVPLLYYIKPGIISKPYVNSNSSYSPETLNLRQNRRFFLTCVTLKFDGWPWKTIGHLFYTALSLVHHFIAISEPKLELQSGNAQFGSKSMIFFCFVWPRNLTDDLEKR